MFKGRRGVVSKFCIGVEAVQEEGQRRGGWSKDVVWEDVDSGEAEGYLENEQHTELS